MIFLIDEGRNLKSNPDTLQQSLARIFRGKALAERSYFEDLVTTYGKTFHTWQIDRDDFSYGIPQLMMAFTRNGQIDEERCRKRAEIPLPDVSPKANGGPPPPDSESHQPPHESLNDSR